MNQTKPFPEANGREKLCRGHRDVRPNTKVATRRARSRRKHRWSCRHRGGRLEAFEQEPEARRSQRRERRTERRRTKRETDDASSRRISFRRILTLARGTCRRTQSAQRKRRTRARIAHRERR